jgi:hypothetical protein
MSIRWAGPEAALIQKEWPMTIYKRFSCWSHQSRVYAESTNLFLVNMVPFWNFEAYFKFPFQIPVWVQTSGVSACFGYTVVLRIVRHPFVTVTCLTNVSFRHLAWRRVTSPQFRPELSYFLQIGCVFWEDLKTGNAKGWKLTALG